MALWPQTAAVTWRYESSEEVPSAPPQWPPNGPEFSRSDVLPGLLLKIWSRWLRANWYSMDRGFGLGSFLNQRSVNRYLEGKGELRNMRNMIFEITVLWQ